MTHEAVDDEVDGRVDREEDVGDGGAHQSPHLGDAGTTVLKTLANYDTSKMGQKR